MLNNVYTKMLETGNGHRLVGAGFRQLNNRWGLNSLKEQNEHDKVWAMGKLYLEKEEGGFVGVGANFHNVKNICKSIASRKNYLRACKGKRMCNASHYAGQHKLRKLWWAKRDTKNYAKSNLLT